MKIVGSATLQVVKEVCRQFNTIPRLMKDIIKLDYAIRVKISTNAFIIEIILPGALEFSLEDRAF
uniref:H(+)-exporting diphosphatase n=1 Tax=Populus tomentosa TaxID=118781 RepID=A0A172CF03_POPTO|nr:Inorganic H pyrophosphatase family protein-1 [Populus tomentosa]